MVNRPIDVFNRWSELPEWVHNFDSVDAVSFYMEEIKQGHKFICKLNFQPCSLWVHNWDISLTESFSVLIESVKDNVSKNTDDDFLKAYLENKVSRKITLEEKIHFEATELYHKWKKTLKDWMFTYKWYKFYRFWPKLYIVLYEEKNFVVMNNPYTWNSKIIFDWNSWDVNSSKNYNFDFEVKKVEQFNSEDSIYILTDSDWNKYYYVLLKHFFYKIWNKNDIFDLRIENNYFVYTNSKDKDVISNSYITEYFDWSIIYVYNNYVLIQELESELYSLYNLIDKEYLFKWLSFQDFEIDKTWCKWSKYIDRDIKLFNHIIWKKTIERNISF